MIVFHVHKIVHRLMLSREMPKDVKFYLVGIGCWMLCVDMLRQPHHFYNLYIFILFVFCMYLYIHLVDCMTA